MYLDSDILHNDAIWCNFSELVFENAILTEKLSHHLPQSDPKKNEHCISLKMQVVAGEADGISESLP